MNYTDTFKSVELVLAAGEVPLLVGETGIGKTALAVELADKNGWSLITIDGNLLKEGEIGGLPTVENHTTVYAIHHKLRDIDKELAAGKTVLLFIDEINRCEHAVQQELMNLILNREINGYVVQDAVKIIAAMNPSDTYDYQTVEMDDAQKNRFVWLNMETDYLQWLDWASEAGIEPKVMEFISTYPDYLCYHNEDDINATPRSYERISSLYAQYKANVDDIPRAVFFNVIRGNVGNIIAEEFVNFVETDSKPLISYNDVFSGEQLAKDVQAKIADETHTRLYLAAKNIMRQLDNNLISGSCKPETVLDRLVDFLKLYPVDLMVGIMKDLRNNTKEVYKYALENDKFVDAYFKSYRSIR